MKLPMREINALYAALDGLMKGGNTAIVRKNNEDVIAMTPFKLSADVYQWAATMFTRLNDLVHGYRTASEKNFATHLAESGEDGKIMNGTPLQVKFAEAQRGIDDAEYSFRAMKLPISALKLDDNPGAAAYLAGLMPLLKTEALSIVEEEPQETAQEKPVAKAEAA